MERRSSSSSSANRFDSRTGRPSDSRTDRKRHREPEDAEDEHRERQEERPSTEGKEKEGEKEEPKRAKRDPGAPPELPVDRLSVIQGQGGEEEEEEDVDLNHLQAQALKAEMMGDTERYTELQEQIRRIEGKPKVEVIMMDGVGKCPLQALPFSLILTKY